MKMTMNFSQFLDNWYESRKNQFSYEGKKALFEYLENYEEETGEQIEFDCIALCCDYTEYKNAMEAAQEYGYEEVVDLEPHGSVDLLEVAELEEKQAKEWLQDRTQVIEFDGGIIIQNF
jgi:hypothetical protein